MSDNPYAAGQHAGHANIETNSHKRIIKRFAPLQLGKLFAVLYGVISLLLVPFILIASVLGPKGSGVGFGIAIFIPVIYTAIGFISGVVGAFVYNLCAKFVGGIEVEIE